MYNVAYSEILEESPEVAREHERAAFDHVIGLMKRAQGSDASASDRAAAVRGLQDLWTLLIDDLSQSENALPETLRADLISIGLWVLRASDRILRGAADGFDGLIAVNTNVRDGLQ